MKKLAFCVALIVMTTFVNIVPAVAAGFQAELLDKKIADIALRNSVIGCSVAVFEGEDIIYSHSWGTAAVRSGKVIPAGPDTKYRVASISKLVTCMLAMTLVEQDKLALDGTLDCLIDKRLCNPAYPSNKPTLENLLTHTSGIVDGAAYDRAISATPFPSLDCLFSWGIAFSGARPGTSYSYSNFGLGLVAAAIENASGEYFCDYANRALFVPMNIDAGYMTDFIKDKSSIAALRDVDPLMWGRVAGAYAAIPKGQMYLLAHGDLQISANDLARIAMILAGDGTYGGKRYLSKASIRQIHTPRITDAATNVTRGLAVQISDDIVPGVRLYGHQGNAYGVISCVFYDPLTRRGVVFIPNGASGARAENQVYRVNNEVVRAVWEQFQNADELPATGQ